MNKWENLYDKLCETAHKLDEWFNVDKVKTYGVYVWSKNEGADGLAGTSNIFDIYEDGIKWWTEFPEHYPIPEEAKPIIEKIQVMIKEFRKRYDNKSATERVQCRNKLVCKELYKEVYKKVEVVVMTDTERIILTNQIEIMYSLERLLEKNRFGYNDIRIARTRTQSYLKSSAERNLYGAVKPIRELPPKKIPK